MVDDGAAPAQAGCQVKVKDVRINETLISFSALISSEDRRAIDFFFQLTVYSPTLLRVFMSCSSSLENFGCRIMDLAESEALYFT